jgi:hypothetical protein
MRSMRPVLAVLVLMLALAAPAAARPVIGDAPAFPSANGRDVAAWSDRAGVHVLRDTQPLGGPTTLPALPACQLGGVNSTALGWLCSTDVTSSGQALMLQDLTTGAMSTPPAAAQIVRLTTGSADPYTLDALGDAVARLSVYGPHDEGTFFYRLSGGALDFEDGVPRGSVLDLDRPTGLRRVCAPAPRRRVTRLLARGPWVLSLDGGRVYLRRCGRRAATLVGSTSATTAVLTGTYAAWATGGYDVAIRMLATGKTYKFPAYGLVLDEDRLPRLAATEHRLWLGDARGHVRVIDGIG